MRNMTKGKFNSIQFNVLLRFVLNTDTNAGHLTQTFQVKRQCWPVVNIEYCFHSQSSPGYLEDVSFKTNKRPLLKEKKDTRLRSIAGSIS